MATGIQITPSSDITVGTTAISNGTEGRVLFQGAGNVVQQSQQFTFEEASNAGILRVRELGNIIYDLDARTSAIFNKPIDVTGNSIFKIATGGGGSFTVRDSVTANSNTQILSTSAGVLMDFNGGGVRRVRIDSRASEPTLQVRAAGALSTDLALRVRNSADTRSNLTVNGLGQTRVLSNSFSGNFFTISYVADNSVERDAFIFTQNIQNAMGQAWTFDAGYNGVQERLTISNNLTGINQGIFSIHASNFCFGTTILNNDNTADRRVLRIATGVAPTTSFTDGFKFYSADIVSGNAAPHFRTEAGDVVKLYKETTAIGGAGYVDGVDDPIRKDTTMNGYTLEQVVKALQNFGLLA
jgi:hypothetical protein